MAKLIAGATVSLDGFVEDADGSSAALYADFDELTASGYMQAVQDETGAVIMGRRTFDMAEDPDDYADNYEFQVPMFVVTHEPPPVTPRSNGRLSVTFVTDGVESAAQQALEAAGDRNVTFIGGADVFGQLLAAGLVDELSVDVMPVLLGDGVRLFAGGPTATLEKVRVEQIGVRTALRYRVVR
ncbi:dihydrofolate reductase [Isoptericola sp. CG 20/1183]|uniref:Dihydrofolate reductase n=1 Tax=Isoptericola halotolerans TaxID=300560 RepID=A0ABX5EG32_9MICO|nr:MULTISPECIES: dihydrofolate reductase family protein [Isoptericola]PRZ08359.1 dihydrofolate reductase [Isoptericola halotolerans]PRZ09156.1 dihydrofolate reductase [Isoptericola sp. CG 20/1183]